MDRPEYSIDDHPHKLDDLSRGVGVLFGGFNKHDSLIVNRSNSHKFDVVR